MKKKLLAVVLSIVAGLTCLFTACSNVEKTNEPEGFDVVVTDQVGNSVTVHSADRIVSGYYISTSVCLALGLKDNLVGIETGSEARPIYNLVAPNLITDAVNVGSAKNFDVESCIKTNPDLVILPKKAEAYYSTLSDLNIPTIVVNPETQELLEEMIKLIGTATGKQDKAESLISYYHEQTSYVSDKVKGISEKPTVYMCNPNSYLKTAAGGMYQSDLIKMAGGINVAENISETSWATVDLETIISYNPDIIIVPVNSDNCQLPKYVEELKTNEALSSVSAIKNGRVYTMPTGYEAWDSPVPSGILGLLWMTKTLHPELVSEEYFVKNVSQFYKTYYGIQV